MSSIDLDLKVVNLWGGPGISKSTTAAGLFNAMKLLGLRVELVTEFAKDLTYEQDWKRLDNQLLVLAEQDHRLRRLVGEVDWVITDSPLPLGLAYMGEEYRGWLPDAALAAYDRYENHDFLLQRCKPYQEYGRSQTESEALALDITIRDIFMTTVAEDGVLDDTAWEIPGDAMAPRIILEILEIEGAEAYLGRQAA